jgi:hypothetical protein
MARKLLVILVVGLVIGTIFGEPPIAIGEIIQSKLVGVKEAAGSFDLDGTYRLRILYLENFEDTDRKAVILTGSIDFDSATGTGTITGDKFFSDGSSEPDAGTGTYTVNPNGSVAFFDSDEGSTWHGDLSSDSKTLIMTLGYTDAGGDILLSILFAIKDEGKLFSVADLNGTYRFCDLELHRFEDTDTDAVVSILAIECDGQGNWTGTYTCFESDGSSESGTVNGTYSVNAENSFEFFETGVSGVNFSADLSSDGNTLILTKGRITPSGSIAQWIGTAIKEDPAKTFSDADLNNAYRCQWLTFQDYESNDKEAEVGYGTFTFDSTGSWTGTANTFDSDGEIAPFTVSGIYRVNPDGSFELTVTSGSTNETLTGNISRDGELITMSQAESVENGYLVTQDLWIRAVINTEEKGPIEAVWQKGGEGTTTDGNRVIWGYFYASPSDVTWGSANNPDLFVKIWFDVSGRLDVNWFHLSVPDIVVYSDYPYDGIVDEQGTTTEKSIRYIRQYYQNGQSYSEENSEDGIPAAGYSPNGNPSGVSTINDLRIGSIIRTVEGDIEAIWRLGGQDTTTSGCQVVWGHFYASPSDVNWGLEHNPDLFVKIWFDVSGRVDVNFMFVSVPDIEVYSDFPSDGTYDHKGTTILEDRYIRYEYLR